MINVQNDNGEILRWIKYKCPECGHTYSLSSAYKLDTTSCPSCEIEIPLVEDIVTYSKLTTLKEKGIKRKIHMEIAPTDNKASWDSVDTVKDNKVAKSSFSTGHLILFGLSFLIIFCSFIFYVNKSKIISSYIGNYEDIKTNLTNQGSYKEPKPSLSRYGTVEFLKLAEPIANALLNASKVEDLLPIIAHPEKHKEKLTNFYPNGIVKPSGLIPFGPHTKVIFKNPNAAVAVKLSNYEPIALVFKETESGLKIDWESWVAWSEMPWEMIIKTKPTKPILVRAKYRKAAYYNFGFADDNQWSCYEITSPNEDYYIYGYVKKGSELDTKLRPKLKNTFVGVTLKISFEETSLNHNQVLIHERLADGWLLDED